VADTELTATLTDTQVSMIKRIERLEVDMRATGACVELPVTHHFSKGVYARELHIPAGTTLTGKVHKYASLNILSKGELSVSTENGIERVCAPFTVVSPPGTKRVAYAHTDCVWTTIHGTDETDIEKIEAKFVTDTHESYLEFCEKLKLQGE
jgi:hypothetical protein